VGNVKRKMKKSFVLLRPAGLLGFFDGSVCGQQENPRSSGCGKDFYFRT
jgi:hypothetical protein